jgi:hypothetical protein
MLLTGNPSAWAVASIAAGHSGGNSFGARLAAAVAERLQLSYLQVCDRPIKGVSHPKEFRRLPPLEMIPIGPHEQTAIIYYGMPSIEPRLRLADELVK